MKQMYEVFFYASRLVIAGKEAKELLNKEAVVHFVETLTEVEIVIREFLTGKFGLIVLTGETDLIWSWFRSCFQEIRAAGGIVRSNSGYLFIYRRGIWDLPKGKIEKGESAESASTREVCEETGLKSVKILVDFPPTWHVYYNNFDPNAKTAILKETHWYLMEASDKQILIPETGEDIEQVKWFNKEDLKIIEQNTFANLIPLISRLKRIIG